MQYEVAPLAERSDLLLLLGDIAQNAGRVDEYELGFDPTWGHLVGRSFPVAGNHDYWTPGGGPTMPTSAIARVKRDSATTASIWPAGGFTP